MRGPLPAASIAMIHHCPARGSAVVYNEANGSLPRETLGVEGRRGFGIRVSAGQASVWPCGSAVDGWFPGFRRCWLSGGLARWPRRTLRSVKKTGVASVCCGFCLSFCSCVNLPLCVYLTRRVVVFVPFSLQTERQAAEFEQTINEPDN